MAKASPRDNPETPCAPETFTEKQKNLLKLAEADVSQKLRQANNTPGKSHKNGISTPRSSSIVETTAPAVKKVQQYASSFPSVTCEEEILGICSEKKISKPTRNGGTFLSTNRTGGEILGRGDSTVETRYDR